MVEIGNVALDVADVGRSSRFYEKLLGCNVITFSPSLAIVMQPSGFHIVLSSLDGLRPEEIKSGGFAFGVNMSSDAEVDALYEEWSALQIAELQPPRDQGFAYAFLLSDPDGHRVRVYHPRLI